MDNTIVASIYCKLGIKRNYFPLFHMCDCSEGRFFITLAKHIFENFRYRHTGYQQLFEVFNSRSEGMSIFVASKIRQPGG